MVKVDGRKACPLEKYARQVVQGKITAGQFIIKSCQRHLNDLENAAERAIRFIYKSL